MLPGCQPNPSTANANTKGKLGKVRLSIGTLKHASMVEYFKESSRSLLRKRSIPAKVELIGKKASEPARVEAPATAAMPAGTRMAAHKRTGISYRAGTATGVAGRFEAGRMGLSCAVR